MSFNQAIGGTVSEVNDEVARQTPGSEVVIDGKVYQYVKFDNGTGNVASAANAIAYWKTPSSVTVTSDVSDSSANRPAGVFLGVLTDGYYGWIQKKGYIAALACSTTLTVSIGDAIIVDTAADGKGLKMTAGTAWTNVVVGFALGNGTPSAAAAYLVMD